MLTIFEQNQSSAMIQAKQAHKAKYVSSLSEILSALKTTLLLLCILISTLFVNPATAEAQTSGASPQGPLNQAANQPATLLNEVHRLYGERFDQSGKYLNDPLKKENFKRRQLEVINTLKSKGFIGDTFVIYNTAKKDLSIRVSIVKDHDQKIHGLFIERSVYDSTTEAFLRLFNLTVLEGGMDLLRFPEGSVVHIQKISKGPDAWTMAIIYPRDFEAKDFAKTTLRILTSTIPSRHAFVNEENFSFSKITLDLWYKIFGGNFGISSLKFE